MADLISRRATLQAASACLLTGAVGVTLAAKAALAAPFDRAGADNNFKSFPWPPQGRPAKPYVIGHRGAPAHRPELSLASYARAIADGADFVEIDLMMTKDGELVIRHDIQLDYTTDLLNHPEFASYRRTKSLYGRDVTAWFVDDFTLAELKTLRIMDRTLVDGDPGRPEAKAYDGWFQILTFEELNDFLEAMESIYRRKIGLVIELKMTAHFEDAGFPILKKLMESIGNSHYLKMSPIIVQSFEISPLKSLFRDLSSRHNVQFQVLVGSLGDHPADFPALGADDKWADLLSSDKIARLNEFTNWLGMSYGALTSPDADSPFGRRSEIIVAAHDASLLVSAWTFRPENRFLAKHFRSSDNPMERNAAGSILEMRHYLALGLDAVITDDPALGRKAVDSRT